MPRRSSTPPVCDPTVCRAFLIPTAKGLIQIKNAIGVLDPCSPQFQKAAMACKGLDNGFGEQSSVAASASGNGGGSS